MTNFQREKALVRDHYAAIGSATPENIAELLARHTTPDWHFRGMHPFHEQHGAKAVAEIFWSPLLAAMRPVQRRQDIFLAGLNEMDKFQSTWVVSMGHLMGLFDKPFLGIRPTSRICTMRYVEFNRVVDGRIAETALFCDIIQIMLAGGSVSAAEADRRAPCSAGPNDPRGPDVRSAGPRARSCYASPN